MKISAVKIFAFIALAGLVNSAIIKPAVCFSHDEVASEQQTNDQCCVACHPAHHQGVVPLEPWAVFKIISSADLVRGATFSLSDPPIRSIFHPPLAF